MSEKIKYAVIGCGHIGKRHATMIQANTECQLVALCDIKPKKDLALENFDVPFYKSIEELFEHEKEIEVTSICTPNGLHAQHCLQALNSNSNVVCEKPMGLTKAECEQVIHKALNVNRQVFCVMQNRYSPPSIWLKEIVDQNILGDTLMVQINCYWNRDERYYLPNGEKHPWKGTKDLDGGTLFTQFSHFIDMMYWLFGDIKNISVRTADFKHAALTDFEDTGVVHFDFVKQGMGSINFSSAVWDKNFESSITILGSKGSVKVGGQYMNNISYCHIENYEMPTLPPSNPPNDYGTYKGSAANHHYVFENVVDVLKGRKTMTTNALEGLKVVEIIERIYNKSKSQ